MRKNSSQAHKLLRNLRDNRLGFHLRAFATSLVEHGYADETVQLKLGLLVCLGRWLQSTNRSITDLNERLLEAFLKPRHRERKGDFKTVKQFRDHLRRQKVVPAPNLPRDNSPLAHILGQYETHLRTERGLVAYTIRQYQSFIRKFLMERFRGRPLLLKAMKASDTSDFVLRHTPCMGVRNAQLMRFPMTPSNPCCRTAASMSLAEALNCSAMRMQPEPSFTDFSNSRRSFSHGTRDTP